MKAPNILIILFCALLGFACAARAEVELRANADIFLQGDTLRVEMRLRNTGSAEAVASVYAVLEAAGQFFFLPGFTAAPAAVLEEESLPVGYDSGFGTLFEATLADPIAVDVPLTWHALALDAETGQAMGEISSLPMTLSAGLAPFPLDPFPTGVIGGQRPAKVVLPQGYSPSIRWPVVFLLHGYGMNSVIQDVYFGASRIADELGFVLILADGNTNSFGLQYWNATNWCCDRENSGVDDVGYLMGLLDEVKARVPVDESRVISLGYSNGGAMSYRLACDRSEVITGIVAVAGTGWGDESRCQPTRPVTVLHVHGTADRIVPYDGAGGQPSADETVQRWVRRNGCASVASLTGTYNLDSFLPGDETLTTVWETCSEETAVGQWEVPGGGHLLTLTPTAIRDALEFALDRPRL